MRSGLLLAAGRGRRMGAFKPLVEVEGQTLLQRALAFLGALGLDEVVVVVGYRHQELLGQLGGARALVHAGWEEGMGSSLSAGVAGLHPQASQVLVHLVDLPMLEPRVGRSILVRAEGCEEPIVAPVHAGVRGHPVLFKRPLFGELLQLSGDRGAYRLLQSHPVAEVEVDSPSILQDIDCPEDLPPPGRSGFP